MTKEASARIKINKLLEVAGWDFEQNIKVESGVKLEDLGDDLEHTKQGFIDYLLLDDKGYPLLVLEAKREDKNPLDGKQQARDYARNNKARFIILSNGNLHYFWDTEHGTEKLITEFPSQKSLIDLQDYKPNHQALASEKVGRDYIALTQMPNYADDPDWRAGGDKRRAFIDRHGLKFLRDYQLEAIHAIQNAAKQDQERYLLEMATGTGKTLTTIAISKLFLRTGNASRILFLVDRIELEKQAFTSFDKQLGKDYVSRIYKDNKEDWRKANVVISTVQTLLAGDRYKKEFDPTDFDLVISDEAHRSIGGNSRSVFEYFIGYKLGLTATPKDYLKNVDENSESQKDTERRQLLDTYKTFGCESGEPTYRYDLSKGAKDGYLIQPTVIDARTDITTQLLSDEGYEVERKNDEGDIEKQVYFSRQFERKFFNQETNVAFCKTFVDNALRDPISNEVGKSLIFCVTQEHASKITHILNQIADKKWPGKYNSDFAVQVTSNVQESQDMTTKFTNNNLNGVTRFMDGYRSSRTRICVTVGMMTTGYDCPDVLNVAFMRPVFSPADFIQMKGRGTRKATFKYEDEHGDPTLIEKEAYKLFDFFAVCEYFEDKFDYDEKLELPKLGKINIGPKPGPPTIDRPLDLDSPDYLKKIKEEQIGAEGMRVDREVWGEQAKKTIAGDKEVAELYKAGNIYGAERAVVEKHFDKPKLFINRSKFKQAFRLDRRPRVTEILEYAFGDRDKFQTKDEIVLDEFASFVQNEGIKPEQYNAAHDVFTAYTTSDEVRKIIDSKEYGRLDFAGVDMKGWTSLPEHLRQRIPEYARDYVLDKVAD
ncbi:MAG TPA: DEAD/DEAH box helicase family protein [Candidatus Saccharimonadales bacterium]|nr:DEAD/DEAH box helicase family protein [Candidatus Saccharimonadales bacterium]